jgi:CBS domain-containing protein
MVERRVGAAVVIDTDSEGIGILTERDILTALADGQDPDIEIAATHLTSDIVFASPDWTLHAAATAMLHGGFRHLIVLDAAEVTGILSVRDVVRMWAASFEDA